MLTPQGFKRKRFNEIFADMEQKAKEEFGENINTSDKSPIGIFLRDIAWELSNTWQSLEKTFNSAYVDTAEGNQLDAVAKYIGISRQQSQRATGEIKVTGESGTVIESGFLVSTLNDVQYRTTRVSMIGENGTAIIPIESVAKGSHTNVGQGLITEIVNPQTGVESVTNEEPTEGGRDKETDEQFRSRYGDSVAKVGNATIESIRATLLNTDGVRDAVVRFNDTNEEKNGIPPKSIAPFVFGGVDIDIANSIFLSKACGIQSYGDLVASVYDSQNEEHLIGFSRPVTIEFYANIELTTNPSFPANGNELVRTKIIEHIGGFDEDGTEYNGLGLGDNVIFTKLISVIHQVPGIDDITLEIGVNPESLGTSNIIAELGEVVKTSYEKVVVS